MSRSYVDKGSARLRTGVAGTLATALERGAATPLAWDPLGRPYRWHIAYSGNCVSPITVYRDGVPLKKGRDPVHLHKGGELKSIMLELAVPCRTCEKCLRRKAAHWRFRAITECRKSERTWFGTLTLSPEQHYRVAMACRAYCLKALSPQERDFDLLPTERQFAERHRCISREITLYVKRLREQSEAELRFLCVTEAHKSGLPHYHMLVHEVNPATPVRHAVLSKCWRVGFSSWKLVEGQAPAAYVCKYLAKSNLARVRASVAYGNTSSDIGLNKTVNTLTPSEDLSWSEATAPAQAGGRKERGPLGGNPAMGFRLPSEGLNIVEGLPVGLR